MISFTQLTAVSLNAAVPEKPLSVVGPGSNLTGSDANAQENSLDKLNNQQAVDKYSPNTRVKYDDGGVYAPTPQAPATPDTRVKYDGGGMYVPAPQAPATPDTRVKYDGGGMYVPTAPLQVSNNGAKNAIPVNLNPLERTGKPESLAPSLTLDSLPPVAPDKIAAVPPSLTEHFSLLPILSDASSASSKLQSVLSYETGSTENKFINLVLESLELGVRLNKHH